MSPMSAEATVIRNYLDWILSVPWNTSTKISKDIIKAKNILEGDHYGLDNVKDRILEYLAVQKRSEKIKGPILCLVGPPGVGKTSLGKSLQVKMQDPTNFMVVDARFDTMTGQHTQCITLETWYSRFHPAVEGIYPATPSRELSKRQAYLENNYSMRSVVPQN